MELLVRGKGVGNEWHCRLLGKEFGSCGVLQFCLCYVSGLSQQLQYFGSPFVGMIRCHPGDAPLWLPCSAAEQLGQLTTALRPLRESRWIAEADDSCSVAVRLKLRHARPLCRAAWSMDSRSRL